jgi:hypothetical protein
MAKEVVLTESDQKLLGIIKANKKGIDVDKVAKELFGRKLGEIARPNQAIYFKVIALNKKLPKGTTIEKTGGSGDGRSIAFYLHTGGDKLPKPGAAPKAKVAKAKKAAPAKKKAAEEQATA